MSVTATGLQTEIHREGKFTVPAIPEIKHSLENLANQRVIVSPFPNIYQFNQNRIAPSIL